MVVAGSRLAHNPMRTMKLEAIARALGGELQGDGDIEVEGVAPLDAAGPSDLTFLANPRYRGRVTSSKAAAILIAPGEQALERPSIVVENPYLAFARALRLFHPPPEHAPGVHPSAVVAPTARLGEGASVGALVVVGARCRLGRDVVLHPGVVLYDDVEIGDGSVLHARSVVREGCKLGARVVLQPGVVVGGDGFGYAPDARGRYHPIPQVGIVELADEVELGSNATVDRATMGVTRIGTGTKLDNLVMVAHGCQVGQHTVMAAQAGLSGSTKVGDHVMLGGQVGVSGHIEIGDRVVATAQTGIPSSIAAGRMVSGSPATDNRTWLRVSAALKKLPELFARVRKLETATHGEEGP